MHRNVAAAVDCLAVALWEQGKKKESLKHYEHGVKIWEALHLSEAKLLAKVKG